MTKWAAVIGDPVDHSLSPALHSKAYELLGLDWQYYRFRVTEEKLGGFFGRLDSNCVGLSVTMPLKPLISQYVDHVEGLGKLLRSVNTVVNGGGLRAAFNTDVYGITEALRAVGPSKPENADLPQPERPVVIGTGATASSALAALTSLGYRDSILVGRRFSGENNAFMSANRIGVRVDTIPLKLSDAVAEAINSAPIVVSTVPPAVTEALAEEIEPRSDAKLLDVTYSSDSVPLKTAFEREGAPVASPLAMLAYQGIAQVKLMTNREVPFEPIFETVRAAAKSGR